MYIVYVLPHWRNKDIYMYILITSADRAKSCFHNAFLASVLDADLLIPPTAKL